MIKQIQNKLEEIEKKENVKIIYAVESGSRAWGFESQDSDYDIRFIYVRPLEFYLRLDKTSEVIEWQLDNIFDINGWDIKKACQLLYKSNPTLLEWCNSPIIYRIAPEFEHFRNISKQYFIGKSGLYHYLKMAKNHYAKYGQDEQIILKKYLYILRPILCCQWILEHNTNPPVRFETLLKYYFKGDLLEIVQKLIEEKKKMTEKDLIDKIEIIDSYINAQFKILNEQVENFRDIPNNNYDEINKLFLKYIKN
ncbi:nucleotidyltransferase [Candidatus Epulonipiscioides gigas]|nr:nucleotidyltransferase [Epulopiscium sp. SCG-C07WGA-EpuloA2]